MPDSHDLPLTGYAVSESVAAEPNTPLRHGVAVQTPLRARP